MIHWKDFILDERFGPILSVPSEQVCATRPGVPSVMEDARSIQETRPEQRPARMVGLSSLDSTQSDKEVSRDVQAGIACSRGEA